MRCCEDGHEIGTALRPRLAAGALLALSLLLAAGPVLAEEEPAVPARVAASEPGDLLPAQQPEWTIKSGRGRIAIEHSTGRRPALLAADDATAPADLPGPDQAEWQITPGQEWTLGDWTGRRPALLAADDAAEPLDLPPAKQPIWKIRTDREWVALGDWIGLGRDTVLLVGYQVLGVGFFYILPESVSHWSQSSKNHVSFEKWWDNVQNPHWDNDEWWVNAGHAYFGAVYYVRARERGFGDVPSFLYSALASCLYEFGVEALFEQPSYQDLIVTPVAGALLGAFVFEPIRDWIKAKPDLAWYDHVLLVATDPIGAANHVVERLLGIKSDIRVDARLPRVAQAPPTGAVATAPNGPPKAPRGLHGVGVELQMRW